MLYENFFNWLKGWFTRRSRCEHKWIETDVTFSPFKELWGTTDTGFRHHLKCTKCGKKEKRTPRDTPEYYIS